MAKRNILEELELLEEAGQTYDIIQTIARTAVNRQLSIREIRYLDVAITKLLAALRVAIKVVALALRESQFKVTSPIQAENYDEPRQMLPIDAINFSAEALGIRIEGSSSTISNYSEHPWNFMVDMECETLGSITSDNTMNIAETIKNVMSQEKAVGASDSGLNELLEDNIGSEFLDLQLDLNWLDAVLDSNNFFREHNAKLVDASESLVAFEAVNEFLNFDNQNEAIEILSDTGDDFLNNTYDIIEVENIEINLDQQTADVNLDNTFSENEKSTLDGVIHILENNLDENFDPNVTYESKDGSLEVEMISADGADHEKVSQDTSNCNPNLYCESDGNDDLISDDESDYCEETATTSESNNHFRIFPLGSNNCRDNKGYLYTKNNRRGSNLYLRCKNSVKHACKARVTVRENDYGQAILTIKHNHPPDTVILQQSIFDKKLEENIEKDPFETPRQLYLRTKTDLIDQIDTENIPPLKKREGFIYRRQKKYIPLLPHTIEQFEEYISDEKYQNTFSKDHRKLPYYRGVWTSVKGERMLVFISETILKMVNTMDTAALFIDGTFKALPHHLQFRQLYVINVTFDNQCYPFAHIFMEKKTFTSYDTVFANLKWLMPSVEVIKVMSDYELATRKALKKHYPNARVSGCFFHYVQAIVKSTKRFGLKSDDRFRDVIKKVSALALLPNDFVLEGFQSIDDSIQFPSKRWNSFKKYWMKQWLPANISVYGLVHRSNNFSESNNKSLNLLLKSRHPNIWRLIMNLKLLEMDKSDLIIRAKKGEMIKTKRNRDMVRLNEKIVEATAKFNQDQNVQEFLSRVSFGENLELFVKDQVNIMDNDASDDDSDADEEVIPNHYNIESDFRRNHPRAAAMPKK